MGMNMCFQNDEQAIINPDMTKQLSTLRTTHHKQYFDKLLVPNTEFINNDKNMEKQVNKIKGQVYYNLDYNICAKY